MKANEIITFLERYAPLAWQADYDNSGLQVGSMDKEITSCLICLDLNNNVLEEAIENNCGLIITHHPLIFRALKKLSGGNETENLIIKAIREDIAIYSAHTNLDHILQGVNMKMAEKIRLKNTRVLKAFENSLRKLVVFCPDMNNDEGEYVPEIVRNALFDAGAGVIGAYDRCSFNMSGTGTFRGSEGTNPFIGTVGKTENQKEIKVETIFPVHLQKKLISAMLEVHPYEEVAYDIYPLSNIHTQAGEGLIGELEEAMTQPEFLALLKLAFKTGCIKHTSFSGKNVRVVALCGGAGSNLAGEALKQNADAFISADFRYHDFFIDPDKLLIADIGHYESEYFTIELLYELLSKNFTNFAFLKTSENTNPVKYF